MLEKDKNVLRLSPRQMTVSVLASLAVLLSGCASSPPSNKPLQSNARETYGFKQWIASRNGSWPENVILISFSGGGVRASALAATVAQQLNDLGLSHNIALISSTSGGSVTAAFIAARGTGRLNELRERFLLHDNQSELAPGVALGLLTGSNRSHHFASYLDKTLFGGNEQPLRFGDLISEWPRSPYVILNASDMSTGRTFEFTQPGFDALCSDLSSFRLSEAAAASAAFPFLMSPITLRNHWDDPVCSSRIAPFDRAAYDHAVRRRHIDVEGFVGWRHRHALRHSFDDAGGTQRPFRRVEYVHLIDGGLSDNLAARALLRAFADNVDLLLAKGVKRILLVQVNAKSDPPNELDLSAETPSMLDVFNSVALNPLDVTSTLSSYVSREFMVASVRSVNDRVTTTDRSQLLFYPVQVDFDHLETGSLVQSEAKRLKTRWSLSPSEIALLDRVGQQLLRKHPCFQAFARDTKMPAVETGEASVCDQFIRLQIAEKTAPPPMPAGPGPSPAPSKPVVQELMYEKVTYSAEAFFDVGKSELKPEAKAKLDELCSKIGAANIEVIISVGHTDSTGPDVYNQSLSLRRSEAVKAYLVRKDIEASRIYTDGKGEKSPVADNKTMAGRAKNRRVEIEFIGIRAVDAN